MPDKVITLENENGPFNRMLLRVLRMVPDKDRSDIKLRRMLAFRLKVDGEAATSEYLIKKIREIIQCAYTGSFYDFIKDDAMKDKCGPPDNPLNPLGAA